MVLHDSKEQFYSELNDRVQKGEITSDELLTYIKKHDNEDWQLNTSGLYELCSKFADISMNAPKQADPITCEVQACFQYSDCNIAKDAFRTFIDEYDIRDTEELLDLVEIMHPYAVAWDDPRSTGGVVRPKDYDWKPGFAGKYHNFKQLPDDIWKKIREEIEESLH